MDRREEILKIFPRDLRQIFSRIPVGFDYMEEIRLRAGQPVFMVYGGREYAVGASGELLDPGMIRDGQEEKVSLCRVSGEQLAQIVEYMSSYSMYAAQEEIRQGFFTIQGGHRIGIAGRAVASQQEVGLLKFISFLNVRISHQIKGCADEVMKELYQKKEGGMTFRNVLLISPPRMGKTTMLRDMIRQISWGSPGIPGMTVGVVDERSELGACYQGVPQNDLGPRTDVLDCCPKVQGMMMLVRSMSPQVVAVDEIGSGEDAKALDYVRNCGCAIAATAHGASFDDIKSRKDLGRLVEEGCFERFVILGKTESGARETQILDHSGKLIQRILKKDLEGGRENVAEVDGSSSGPDSLSRPGTLDGGKMAGTPEADGAAPADDLFSQGRDRIQPRSSGRGTGAGGQKRGRSPGWLF